MTVGLGLSPRGFIFAPDIHSADRTHGRQLFDGLLIPSVRVIPENAAYRGRVIFDWNGDRCIPVGEGAGPGP